MRFWFYLLSVTLIWFAGGRVYRYFFDTTVPMLSIKGLQAELTYAGDVKCELLGSKKSDVSLFLDEKPLAQQLAVLPGQHGKLFVIPTKTLSQGKHILKADIVDRTYHKNRNILEVPFFVDNVPLQAALLKSDEEFKVFQGRTLHVQFQTNKELKKATLTALSHVFECFPESKNAYIYEAFIPVACEENPNEYLFSIDLSDKVGNALRIDNKFQIVTYPFKKSTMHVQNEKMVEEAELGRGNKELEECFGAIAQNSGSEKLWRGAFCTPIEVQRVSTDYGTIRTTQYKGMYAHKAIDVINVPKSVVWAPQAGRVALKDRFVDTGNTVIIDHGRGVVTMLCHLDTFNDGIKEGDIIQKGNPVGTIGKTGYASGYHVHWEMRINNVPVDPMQWTKSRF